LAESGHLITVSLPCRKDYGNNTGGELPPHPVPLLPRRRGWHAGRHVEIKFILDEILLLSLEEKVLAEISESSEKGGEA